jgi:hypothetical protein
MNPDGFINGQPVYFKPSRHDGKSSLQLEMYAKLMKDNPDSKFFLVMPRHAGRTEAKKLAAEFKQTFIPESDRSNELTYQDIIDAVNKLRDWPPHTGPYHFWTAGTGIPDEMAIEYWKDTNIIVVTRDGKKYQRGKLLEDV